MTFCPTETGKSVRAFVACKFVGSSEHSDTMGWQIGQSLGSKNLGSKGKERTSKSAATLLKNVSSVYSSEKNSQPVIF